MKYLSNSIEFYINDIDIYDSVPYINHYVEIIRDLIDRDVCIDSVGAQMHIFNPEKSRQIAEVDDILYPDHIMNCLRATERSLHISEVTIREPDTTRRVCLQQCLLHLPELRPPHIVIYTMNLI